ncbi:hypothetical protein N7495_001110 [Penicillium taxi]|uniref:uncharacterized protein n=1 Tax=Penicillium taxi TaxID=168475 RepID=UPI0025457D5B|nr:uncharacterized protein N7495_001110 [Penicillium taxi]KAJ5908428.1 hypothetical protein N7495_001110 [Penicillium taxi]
MPKRKADVDVPGDESPRTSKQRQTVSFSESKPDTTETFSSGQRLGENTGFFQLSQVAGADDEDERAAELVESTQAVNESSSATSILYGTLPSKIVGVQYYRGLAVKGERVLPKREPENQYDRNAIKVFNVMGVGIGHIPRQVAAKLAKYLDNGDLLVEAVLTDRIKVYDCPVMLKLYGSCDLIKRQAIKKQMQADRLPVRDLTEYELSEARAAKEQEQALKKAAKQARAMALGKAKEQWQQNDDSQFSNLSIPGIGDNNESMEELLQQSSHFNPREIGQVVETFGQTESDLQKMPMADTPVGLSTELLPYQKQGLAWMIRQESPKLPEKGSDAVIQLWKRDGSTNFTNVATNFTINTAPPLASGGILADDMGLGKTIQIISLILANPTPSSTKSDSSKTTLIIAPVGVMSNWRNQIQDHTRKETAPHILIYHGSAKKESKNLANYDVVITSYGALAKAYKEYKPEKKPTGDLFSIHWRRVVLDEGHVIRNPRAQASLAASSLQAESRWTLTGTPIINTLLDLYSQVRFLKLSGGLEDKGVFNSVLIRPLMAGDPEARLLLEALMGTICLRRRKDMNFINLRLPPMTSRVLHIKFHPHELEKYSAFQLEAKGALLDYKDKQGAGYSHLLEVLLRMRQVCNHWALCRNRVTKILEMLDKQKVVPLTPENMKGLQEMLQIQIESQEMCAICLDTLDQPVITACAHAYCRGCIEQVIERQAKCPLCRADLKDTSSLVSPAVEGGEDDSVAVDPDHPSSKIEALVKILTAQGQEPGTKTVVFSQWTSFLDLVRPHLEIHGIKFVCIDGRMPSGARDNSINAFSNDPECTVLLASLSVCSVGLNLVAANQAILCDSWWAPAIEDQAVDRVYRLGQKRSTTVWRLIVEGSIEQRVLEIQERKRQLMLSAFRETGKKRYEDRATRIADLATLLG